MRLFATTVLLACASCAIAQTPPGDTPAEKPPTPGASTQKKRFKRVGFPSTASNGAKPSNQKATVVPPGTPLVTLDGVCKEPSVKQPKAACKTVITREDLERFTKAFAPETDDAARGRVAVQYAKTLAFSALAEQQGLDKNPSFANEIDFQLKLIRMRMLASAFLQIQQHKVSLAESEIQKYYDDHKDQYEQVLVRRLAVPDSVPTEDGRRLNHSAVMSEIADLRARAVAGEDLNRLLQDAYKHLHIQATPPPVNVMLVRRGAVQGDEAKAFDLKPGDVSPVIEFAAATGFLKLESKDVTPIQAVRQEIETALRRDRMQDELNEVAKKISAQFNLQYFDMASQPNIFSLTAPVPAAGSASIRPTPAPSRP